MRVCFLLERRWDLQADFWLRIEFCAGASGTALQSLLGRNWDLRALLRIHLFSVLKINYRAHCTEAGARIEK